MSFTWITLGAYPADGGTLRTKMQTAERLGHLCRATVGFGADITIDCTAEVFPLHRCPTCDARYAPAALREELLTGASDTTCTECESPFPLAPNVFPGRLPEAMYG